MTTDLNIHHRSWLRHSREDTTKGRRLKEICDCHDIKQMMTGPTRGDYLLDLALASHADLKIRIGPKIADHASIFNTIDDSLETRVLVPAKTCVAFQGC